MTGWLEVMTIAFVAQLAVLPGEKVQFIIAALSTRYSPWIVVAAAGSAFAGWTALEIVFGQALKDALPAIALDALTGALFLLFAVLLLRSAPDPGTEMDGGAVDFADGFSFPTVFGHELPEWFGGFVPVFAMMAFGEFGDKTQLVTIGLAVQYGATSAIWAGEMLAIIPVSLANAFFFHRFSHRLDLRKAHHFSAALFGFFAFDVVLKLAVGFSIWEEFVATISHALLSVV